MADIGRIALFLALVASVYSAIAFAFGARGRHPALMKSAGNSLLAVFGLVSISLVVLLHALLIHNFRIEYVSLYTSRDLPLPYLISALWAGNDGSLLFWAWLLSLFATVVVIQKRNAGVELVSYASSIIMFTETFFLILLLLVSNPFHTLFIVPADGIGLNPLLENPGMIIHPPVLLAGYISLAIPFAFAIAALLSKRLGNEWLTAIRRWMLLGWLLLGAGNIIGAWWAYVELGWGGYWAWDPVENAGLMPWLVATAFLHSMMMQRRRGMLKVWNMVLIILTFNFTIFGTFLTRSGIISSLHTFSESALGPFFLVFIGIALFGSLGLLYYRHNELRDEMEMDSLVSRESTFLLNNLLLVGATFVIFLGTIFPVLSEAVGGVKITVGPSFFNKVNGPIFLTILLLAGICIIIGWRRASIKALISHLLWPVIMVLSLGVALFFIGIREGYALVAFLVCGSVFFSIFYKWFRDIRARQRTKAENYLKAFWGVVEANRPRYGGYIIHIAIVFIAIGVIGSSFYKISTEAVLAPGQSVNIKSYTLIYDSLDDYQTQNKLIVTATLSVYNGERLIGKVLPEIYFHRSYEQPVTEVAIRTNLLEDLYVILLGWDESENAAFNVMVNPLVSWIWIGGGVLVLGGLVAFWPGRRSPRLPGELGQGGNKDTE